MKKEDFIAVFETTLLCANLDIIGLSLVDDSHVLITFKGNGTRKVNIEADSYGAIIVDVMKHAFQERKCSFMCMKNNQPVNEYNSPCGSCPEYLNSCMPIVVDGFICGECDLYYCEWCSCYDDCMNGGVEHDAVKL